MSWTKCGKATNEGPMRREVRTHGGIMISGEVRPRMMGKGIKQETVTRETDSKHEREAKRESVGNEGEEQ